MDVLFAVINLSVLPIWLLLIALPRWRVTQRLLASPWVLAPLPICYALLLVLFWPSILHVFTHPTLEEVRWLLGTRAGALIAWLHFLALDLVAGRCIYLDSQRRGFDPFWLMPVFWATFLLGPIGVLMYVLICGVIGQGSATGETQFRGEVPESPAPGAESPSVLTADTRISSTRRQNP